jgi:WD40 repeat protein
MAVWDVDKRKRIARMEVKVEEEGILAGPVALSPDGRYVAFFRGTETSIGNCVSCQHGGSVHVWDVASGKRLHRFETALGSLAFSADSRILATAEGDVLDLRTGKLRRAAFGAVPAVDLAFSPDGKTLAVTKNNGWIELWDSAAAVQTGALPTDAVKGGERFGESVVSPVFSGDARILAATFQARITGENLETPPVAVQLWDLGSRLALGAPVETGSTDVPLLAFDGNLLRLTDFENPLRSLETDAEALVEAVCKRAAGRDITPQEWETYVPEGMAYRKVCG